MEIVAHGIDYFRYKTESSDDIELIERELPYVEIFPVFYHGIRHVNLSGSALELIRMIDNVEHKVLWLARTLPVTRVDIYVDVLGNVLDKVKTSGTVISNGGNVETMYCSNLGQRGNKTVFCRAYDAMAAGHYSMPVTRFEVEYKREMVRALVGPEGWNADPIGVTLRCIQQRLGVEIEIQDVEHCELKGVRKKLESSRERFYKRFGKGIARDVSDMGFQNLLTFIYSCIERNDCEKDDSSM